MNKTTASSLILALSAFTSSSSLVYADIPKHIPKAIMAQHFADLGKVDPSKEVPITIALRLNHEDELDQQLIELYRSNGPQFHHFLKTDEFKAHYSPTEQQVSQVKDYLLSQGVTPLNVSKSRLFIHAKGTIQAINAAFKTELHHFLDPKGKMYFAPHKEIELPSGLHQNIQAVHGLHNLTHFRSYARRNLSNQSTANQTSTQHLRQHIEQHRDGSGPAGGLSPSDIRQAYEFPSQTSSINGAGQTLALFELDGYDPADISAYERYFNLPQIPLKNILVGDATGEAGGGAGEVTLDIELMTGIAPGVKQILVYEGINSDQGMIDTYSRIADDNIASQVSTSWGISEDNASESLLKTENTIFKQMAAQGQSLYAAAGDDGAYDDGSTLSVDDPGAQPYAVAVGGTSLTTGANGTYVSETTWNASNGQGGGGISTLWPQPSWQHGVVGKDTLGSVTMRNVPDVALESDINVGYAIYYQGTWGIWGGTSCAAPIWAAFTALVNQERTARNMTPLGFPSPALYAIGKTNRYSQDFHDIRDGSTNGYYPAVTGYDDATGWGSLKAMDLLKDLVEDQ